MKESSAKRYAKVIVLLFFMATGGLIYAINSTGPPSGRTGAPALGIFPAEPDCTECHSGNPLNAPGGALTISNVPANYTPGQTVTLTVTLTRSGQPPTRRWGFQITALTDGGEPAGTFASINSATFTQTGFNDRQYVQHTFPGTQQGAASGTWSFNWTAPSTPVGRVTFYAAGNAANGNGAADNRDFIYTTSASTNPPINLTPTLTAPVAADTVTAGGQFNITWTAPDVVTSQDIALSTDGGNIFPIVVASGLAGSARSFQWNVPNIITNQAKLRLTVRDASGNSGQSDSATFAIVDRTNPVVSVTAPREGDRIPGGSAFNIAWESSDNIAIASHDILLSTDGGANFSTTIAQGLGDVKSFSWDVPANLVAPQARIRVVARDTSGNSSSGDSRVFSVVDQIRPTVSITAPAGGATVSGAITVTADASDNIGVVSVKLFVDGNERGEDSTPPFTFTLDTTTLTNGNHALTAEAADAAGNRAISDAVTITVRNNRAPVIADIAAVTMDAGSSRNIPLTISDADGDPLTVTVTGAAFASIIRDSSTGAFTLRLEPGAGASGTFILTIRVSDGKATVEKTVQVTVNARPAVKLGDINGDGQITVQDLIALIQHLAGAVTLTGDAAIAADVDKNGSITVQDLILLIQVLLGVVQL